MAIKESAENYLETILMLSKKHAAVRSVDIAHALSFTKPSISVAMKALRADGYINVDADGHITLTESGKSVAEKVLERHEVIAKALMALGVGEKTAYEDSCKIEHCISIESFEKLKDYMEKK